MRISQSYPAIPRITPDGIFGPATREAVEVFQSVFGLPVTGVIDTGPGIKFPKSMSEYPESQSLFKLGFFREM